MTQNAVALYLNYIRDFDFSNKLKWIAVFLLLFCSEASSITLDQPCVKLKMLIRLT